MGSGGATALWSLSKLVGVALIIALIGRIKSRQPALGRDVASFVALVVDVYVEAKAT